MKNGAGESSSGERNIANEKNNRFFFLEEGQN
jgi:hypothetical protein